jgi:hypothetical protein
MGAGIPADGTRSDNGYLPTHAFLPAFLAAEASAPAALVTTFEPPRTGRQADSRIAGFLLSQVTRLYDAGQTAENTETKMMRFIHALLRCPAGDRSNVRAALQPDHSHE